MGGIRYRLLYPPFKPTSIDRDWLCSLRRVGYSLSHGGRPTLQGGIYFPEPVLIAITGLLHSRHEGDVSAQIPLIARRDSESPMRGHCTRQHSRENGSQVTDK